MNTTVNKPLIEPGVLRLFRILTLIQWGILLFAFYTSTNGSDAGTVVIVTLLLLHSTILLLYLRIERFQRWFRRLYLPLALIGAGFAPILVRAFGVAVRLENGLRDTAAASDQGTLVLWLFAPLVVISAQYGIWTVVVFGILTTLLELALASGLADVGSVPLEVVFEQEVIRNLVFLAIGYIISQLISEQRSQRKKLEEANAQLTQFAVTLEQLAISRERNRMARDLHDTLAHTLSAVSIQLEAVTTIWDKSPERAKERILKIQTVTREGLTETRRALQALRSSPVDDLGLAMALQFLAEKSSDRAGFELHSEIPDNLPEFSAETELTVYRIAEEALNNIVQHAEATYVWLTLSYKENNLELRVRDNGIGFDTAIPAPEGHYGLTGMQERAALSNGELHIESEQHIGTLVQLVIKGVSL